MIITGLVLVGILGAGFFYLSGPSEAQMSKALYAIKLPSNFHVVGTVDIHSGGSFAGDCFDSCSGGDLVAENPQSTSVTDREKNLEAADVLVKSAGWQLVHSASTTDTVRNTYCKSRMQLEVISGLRHPNGSDLTQQTEADRLAGLEYSLESRKCSY